MIFKREYNSKKAATPLTVLLLVLMTLALVATALFMFATTKNRAVKKISDVAFMKEIYLKEEKINFLLSQGLSIENAARVVEGARSIENGKRIKIEKRFGSEVEVLVSYTYDPKIP